MKKIRIANTSYLSSTPYRNLSQLDFVEYQENVPTENARKLHEGEVDLALIPTFEYAMQGSYLGLDFGIACEEKSELLTLFARQPIENLQRIFLYPSSSSSYWLLRLLMHFKWGVRPKLIRSSGEMKLSALAEYEGILLRRTSFQPEYEQLPCRIDLVQEWFEFTRQPFVFLIWAARPGVFDQSLHSAINAEFHKMVKAFRESEFQRKMRDAHMLEDVAYYLEERHLQSLDFSFQLGKESGILPASEYQNARFPLLPSSSMTQSSARALSDIYDQILGHQRLSVDDALSLCQQAPTADLLLLNQQTRSESGLHPHVEKTLAIETSVSFSAEVWPDCVTLNASKKAQESLEILEQQIIRAKNLYKKPVQALSVLQVHSISQQEGLSILRVLERLKIAGLNYLDATGSDLLLDRCLENTGCGLLASEYLQIMDLAQGLDISTVASMPVSLTHTWQDRLAHLQKLRQLEDQNPGIRYILLVCNAPENLRKLEQLYLRVALITSLFADNIEIAQSLSDSQIDLSKRLIAESCGGKLLIDARGEFARHPVAEILGHEYFMSVAANSPDLP